MCKHSGRVDRLKSVLWNAGGSAGLLLLLALLYVHRDHDDYQGRGAKDGHLDFTQLLRSECLSSVLPTETVHTIRDQDVHLDFHTAPELVSSEQFSSILLYDHWK